MFEHFKAHLEALATPDQRDMLIEAVEVIYQAGYERIDYILDQEMAVQDNLGNDFAFSVADQIVRPTFDLVFSEFGVEVYNTAPIPLLTRMLQCLHGLDNFDDIDALVNLVQADESPEEILAEIITHTTEGTAEDILEHLAAVRPSLIERMQDILITAQIEQDDPGQYPDMTLRLQARDRLRQFLSATPTATWIRTQMEQGLILGLPYPSLFQTYQEHLSGLWDTDMNQTLTDLVCLVLASDAAQDAIDGHVRQFISDYAADMDQSTQALAIYRGLIERLQRH